MDKNVTNLIMTKIDKIDVQTDVAHFRQTKVASDSTGRFNIGEAFLPNSEETTSTKPAVAIDPNKYCEICNISVTSQPQMKLHLEGSKHAKKLKAMGMWMISNNVISRIK